MRCCGFLWHYLRTYVGCLGRERWYQFMLQVAHILFTLLLFPSQICLFLFSYETVIVMYVYIANT